MTRRGRLRAGTGAFALSVALAGSPVLAVAAQTADPTAGLSGTVPTSPPPLLPAPTATSQRADTLSGLAGYIERAMPDWGLAGLAVAVVHDDSVILARGFGVKELGRPDPVDAETLFQIGSVSKSFAAAALAALVDDGLVTWDDPVVRHLPWFRVRDPWATRAITIRDLLAHRSGMPGDALPVLAVMDAREAAERLRRADNVAPLRQAYRYSNQAYGVAGLVVEAVTGLGWGDWLRLRVFDPLDMRRSAASPYEVWDDRFVAAAFLGAAPAGAVGIDDAPGHNVAMPHGVARDGSRRVLSWQSYDAMQAAGSVVSNAVDLGNWLRMHLNGGAFDGEEVLSGEVVAEMHARQIGTGGAGGPFPADLFADRRPRESGDSGRGRAGADGRAGAEGGLRAWTEPSYGLGWSRASFAGHVKLSHGGGIFGFPSYVAMLPEVGVGVAVLANGSLWTPYYPHQEIAAWVFARMIGAEERDWHGEVMERTGAIEAQVEAALAAQDAARISGTRPSLALGEYVGAYEHQFGGEAYVELVEAPSGSRLRVHYGEPGSFSGTLEHWHHDVFRLFFDGGDGQAYGSAFVTFTIGPRGGVDRMDMGFMGRYRLQPSGR